MRGMFIYIHCMEKFEVLHNTKIIHGDIKPGIFLTTHQLYWTLVDPGLGKMMSLALIHSSHGKDRGVLRYVGVENGIGC
jgi:tRNA A-37 threonylcarbamoyl transferase component Bud32